LDFSDEDNLIEDSFPEPLSSSDGASPMRATVKPAIAGKLNQVLVKLAMTKDRSKAWQDLGYALESNGFTAGLVRDGSAAISTIQWGNLSGVVSNSLAMEELDSEEIPRRVIKGASVYQKDNLLQISSPGAQVQLVLEMPHEWEISDTDLAMIGTLVERICKI
jgi:hypothetical protein